jgi:hypothetical protein
MLLWWRAASALRYFALAMRRDTPACGPSTSPLDAAEMTWSDRLPMRLTGNLGT